MRAITYTHNGDPDVLTLADRPMAEPGPGEVRVRIHRSGVNPTDWKSRQGSTSGSAVDPPQVPNQDGSGVVDAVGPGVEEGLVGLRVWVWESAYQRPEGTAQEYALVLRRNLALLPDVASFDLGASLGVPFLTAHRTPDRDRGRPGRGSAPAPCRAGPSWSPAEPAPWATPRSSSPAGPTRTVITTVSSPEKAQPRRAGRRRPRHRLPAAGRRRRGAQDRSRRRRHHRGGGRRGQRRDRQLGHRPARVGRGVRRRRRRTSSHSRSAR